MNFRKSVYIIICCQMLLCLLSFNNLNAQSTDLPKKIPRESAIFRTIDKAKTYIVNNQNIDGGWPLIPGEKSDVEITALAIWALTEAGWGTGSRVIRSGVRYLRDKQREDGSWNNNTAHTSFALIALRNAKTDEKARFNGLQWLMKAQNRSGSWGRKHQGPGDILHTSTTLVGFKKLGFTKFKPIPPGMDWLANEDRVNVDGAWNLRDGTQTDIYVTSWVILGLLPNYDLDEQVALIKQFQNKDGGFGRFKGKPSDPEVTAIAIMAFAANNDPLNTRRIAISYLTKGQEPNGSYKSAIPESDKSAAPIGLQIPKANLQTTCFVLIAIHTKLEIDE